jgi:hypothetical protein
LYGNGQKQGEGTFKNGKKNGKWTSWHDGNGQKESEGTYKDGELISEKCWDEDGNECECDECGRFLSPLGSANRSLEESTPMIPISPSKVVE